MIEIGAILAALLDRYLAWRKRHVATMDYLTARNLAMAKAAERSQP